MSIRDTHFISHVQENTMSILRWAASVALTLAILGSIPEPAEPKLAGRRAALLVPKQLG